LEGSEAKLRERKKRESHFLKREEGEHLFTANC